MKQAVVLIPAYKPERALVDLCEALAAMEFAVVCVDDGSGEKFDPIFEGAAAYAEVLRYPKNKGKGGALKYGITHIAESERYADCPWIVTADADGQHRPEDIERVALATAQNGGLVLGTRRFTGKVPFKSRAGNAITRAVFSVASGKFVYDTQTGLRGFEKSRGAFYAAVPGDKYEYEMQVLFAAVDEGIEIRELSIATVYENNNEGSHFHPVRDSYRIYKTIFLASRSLKYLFSSLLAFLIDYILVLLLNALIPGKFSMEIAAVLAWCTSSLTNFFINRNFVFRSDAPLVRAMPEYYGLAAVVFFLKTLLLEIFTRILHVPLWLSKLVAEIIFFVSNYFIQKKLIFRRKRQERE